VSLLIINLFLTTFITTFMAWLNATGNNTCMTIIC
jgi:hypothetical protein